MFLLYFGDFSHDEYSPLEQFIFVLGVISAPLVLLNMLIAIMGDTFDRVKEEQVRRDFQELAGLVYRYEIISAKLCCMKRKKRPIWKYIYYSQEVKHEGDEAIEPWEGRIRGIKKEISKLIAQNLEMEENLKEEFKEHREQLERNCNQ